MAETNNTTIQLYYSATPSLAPSGSNLSYGELALNIFDGKLYFKDSTNTVSLLASTSGAIATVQDVSVVTANGFSGSVADPSVHPAITINTTITGVLKGDGSAISSAVAGTDYAPATSGTGILKGNGAGGFSAAVSGTDYAPATSGTSILYGDGLGGFNTVTIGSTLSFSGGTLSVSSAPSLVTTNWTVSESGGKLYFAYGGVNKASLDSSGNFIAIGNVTAYGTP